MKAIQPRKQRKWLYNLPMHLRRKQLSAHFSKELMQKYKRRNLPVRKGDEVEILRGNFRGKKGKISKVDLSKFKIYVDGVTRKKTTGTEAQVPIHASKVRIINLNLEDKRRVAILERKGVKAAVTKPEAKVEKKAEEKIETKKEEPGKAEPIEEVKKIKKKAAVKKAKEKEHEA